MTASVAIHSSMPYPIVYTEAMKDSPRFRASISQHTQYFNKLENRLNEILKHVTAMMEYSKNYIATLYKFTVSVNQLCDESFSGNALSQPTFQSLSEAFGQTLSLSKSYYEQTNLLVYEKLASFLKQELTKVSTARAHFDTMSSSMDEALARNSSISRQKPNDAAEGRNALTAIGACFAHTTLDYVAQINVAHAKKDYMIIDALWSFVKETSSFFSRGHAVFDEWTAADNGSVAETIATLSEKCKHTERKMQDIHSLVPKEMFQHPSGMPPDPDVMMEGYLLKRSSNAFKTWNRRWFQIRDNKLLYSHRSNDYEEPTIMEENLKLCLVRPAPPSIDRAGCFELVTPTRSHLLQADTESLCNNWMRALQRTILALHECDDENTKPSSSNSETTIIPKGSKVLPNENSTTFEQIRRVPGNESCADCGSEQPKWVSINLGVVLCIECSGVHRSLGVQVTKVRSLTMDSIDTELRDVLLSLGNKLVNSIYLAHLPQSNVVPPEATETCNRQVREAWIKAKYVERRFSISSSDRARGIAVARHDNLQAKQKTSIGNRSTSYADVKEAEIACAAGFSDDKKRLSSCGSEQNIAEDQGEAVSWKLIAEAARSGDIVVLLRAIASKFDLNTVQNGTTLLHMATQNGQTAAVEFLLLNGAKINILDERLNSPMHLAALEGNTLQVCQLLKRGADKDLKNADGVTPLDIAIEGKHADIVTLFRVHTMRDEFNEEFDNPMNETVDNVISDITRRAAENKSSSG
ncbi:unnamed protein product [Auanema sp. JU1783]|nr:unnamed protein product [Auanema sp. JU1783]